MTSTPAAALDALLREFEGPWRDETPVFGCCRKSVAAAIEGVDAYAVATQDVTARVQALRAAIEAESSGHLDSHRCCSGHVADLAFDLPDLLAPVHADVE